MRTRIAFFLTVFLLATLAIASDEPYLFPIEADGLWGYIDATGKIALKQAYQSAAHFAEGAAPVKIGTTFGYINRSGTVIIQPQFDEARFFYKALAPVRKGSTWGYIDHTGKFLISPKFEVARSFQDDVARVQINGLWGYIDTAPVKTGGLRGYIDKAGAFAIKLRFEIAHSFSDRWADVKIAGNGVTSTAKVRLRFRPGLTKPVRCGPGLLLRGRVPSGATSLATFRSKSNRSSTPPGPFNRAWPT